MSYTHPGVYIEEDKLLALSVPTGETAVPVFVGVFLDRGTQQPITTPCCTKIHNWKEFEDQFYVPFGGPSGLTVTLTPVSVTKLDGYTAYLGAPSVRAYFENGGGPCYVLPVKRQPDYTEAVKLIPDLIRAHPEISMLCYCELTESDDQIYGAFAQLLNDKAGYFVLADGDEKTQPSITPEQAAIYYPALRMTYRVAAPKDDQVTLTISPPIPGVTNLKTLKACTKACTKVSKEKTAFLNTLLTVSPTVTNDTTLNELDTNKAQYTSAYDAMKAAFEDLTKKPDFLGEDEHKKMLGTLSDNKEQYLKAYNKKNIDDLFTALGEEKKTLLQEKLSGLESKVSAGKKEAIKGLVTALTAATDNLSTLENKAETYIEEYPKKKAIFEKIIQNILDALDAWSVVYLRASVAMAGVYAKIDRDRGVWKAPANTMLSGVEGLVWSSGDDLHKMIPAIVDDDRQDRLNPQGINAIRYFSSRGFMVWGARTLAGKDGVPDTRWRYVPVRRLFNAAERDIKQAMRAVMFEPNNSPTWEKVRAAIDSYLHNLWRMGALQGAKPEEAYFVQVGRGVTMTDDQIQRGQLIVKVGMAAVRPAEFIILRFTQNVAIAAAA
ncbi:hypothetical protein DFQ28_005944 [Apophysomyces sp. BC1034]|nr:hypothetical protein DFQ30_006410 [Apophysomyces sp. BC1015]KAG0187724.1 hypothetical protein DFQ28_005944 [Apophysomyces sp. BC1034]